VLDVLDSEKLVENAEETGNYLMEKLAKISQNIQIRGEGLMIGLEFPTPIQELRKKLLFEHKIFTGVSGQNMIRLLPPLSLKKEEADLFLKAFAKAFAEVSASLIDN
uniref:aminotransferase class III-fold pyridoxal phosphate-dependent enzyme n=1 Tax=Mariniphaga sediminis TaxID=1628158 RepID=UPI00356401A5